MDVKHDQSESYFQAYTQFFLLKYKNTKFDLVISTDNAAFNFLVKYKKYLPGNPPAVFCGLNYVDSIPDGFTGIMEDIEIKSNIQSILKIHPGYKKLYIINDRTETGIVIRTKTDEIISNSFPELKYEFLTDYSFSELKTKLASITEGSIVLLFTFNIDKNGYNISYDNILKEINPFCKVPVYGTWDFYLNNGIVGGKITRSATHGENAADIALKVLHGLFTSTIPVSFGTTEYMYDYRQLKFFKIKKSKLPAESIIINSPFSVLKKNLKVIVFVGILIILLIGLIFIFFKLFHKERHIRKREQHFVQEFKNKSTELENALQLAEKSSQLKTAFLSNLSHEIRTPMNAIVGFSDLLTSTRDEKQEEYVSIIKASSLQLLSIINDIIEMSMIDTNQVNIHLSAVNVNQVIDEVYSSFSMSADSKVEIRKKPGLENSEATITTDEVKFRQILSNLLSNALKFTENGFVEIGYFSATEFLEFYVKDTGIGIDSQFHEEIFERFRRVEHSDISLFRGLGIGLTLSQSYVKILGGNIWLHSEPGNGSTFYFTVPYKKVLNISEPKLEPEKPDLKNHVILICEDDDNNLLYFKELFSKTNTFILYAKNGKEAVKVCRENPSVDLVLMDLKMPEMNGWDATKIIKGLRPDLAIIAQTAHALALETNQLTSKGFDDYVTKPIKKSELFEKISRYIK